MTDQEKEMLKGTDFEESYEELRYAITSRFKLSPGEYNILKEAFNMFYDIGKVEMKAFCISVLEEKMRNCNDSVPKTLYPSDKYKFAIKVIKEIK